MRIGFAGLGRMGVPMARNLARAGFDLTLWNRTEAKARALADHLGCRAAATPRSLADHVDVVITMLADDASSEAVHTGPEGIFAAGGPRYVVAMGTMSPDHIARLARAAPEGVTIIDAPVSGATQAARDVQLLIMAGCTETQAQPLLPVFEAMGKRTICLGNCAERGRVSWRTCTGLSFSITSRTEAMKRCASACASWPMSVAGLAIVVRASCWPGSALR